MIDEDYDFKASGLAQRLREAGTILSMEQEYWHATADALFLHRKIGGMYLLALRSPWYKGEHKSFGRSHISSVITLDSFLNSDG